MKERLPSLLTPLNTPKYSMNFPTTQKTGVLAEIAVSQLFISWGWNVGQDRIDIGYDLFIAPTHEIYKGGRFLVQVKGTLNSKKTDNIRVSVSKNRLRQYAESSIPVFIIRVTSEGRLYWLHVQEWALQNESRLSGTGYLNIKFDPNKELENRENFEHYLKSILDSIHLNSRQISLPESLNNQSSAALKSSGVLDENHELPDNLLAELSFIPVQNPKNIENIKDSIYFGLPRKIAVESFNIKGLPLPNAHLGKLGKGEITLDPTDFTLGKIRLIPGKKRAVTSTEIAFDAEVFSGQRGIAITNERNASLLDICIRLSGNENYKLTPKAKINFRMPSLSQKPIRSADQLNQIHLWAEQALNQRSFSIELDFLGQRIPLPLPNEHQESAMEFLHMAYILGKIHLIARTTNSTLYVPIEFSISRDEIDNIETAFSLLRGDKKQITSLSMRLESYRTTQPTERITLIGRKKITFMLFEQELCKIPVQFDLIDYRLEEIPGSTDMDVKPNNHSKAWISFAADYSDELEDSWFSNESAI